MENRNENNIADRKTKVLILCFIAVLVALTSIKYYKKYYVKEVSYNKGKTIQEEFKLNVSDDKNKLELKALNGNIAIKGYEGSEIILNTQYILKEDGHTLAFYKDNKKGYVMNYDETKFKEVSIDVLVPFNHFKNVNVLAINSKTEVENLQAKDLSLKSMNGKIYIQSFKGEEIQVENLNASIAIEESVLEDLKVKNMNGSIEIENCDVKNIEGANTNGSINIFKNESLSSYDKYKWDIQNQNGKISLKLDSNNINYNIDAKTSNGNIMIEKNNLQYSKNNKNEVSAKTENPDKAYKSLNLSLKTSNSSIILK